MSCREIKAGDLVSEMSSSLHEVPCGAFQSLRLPCQTAPRGVMPANKALPWLSKAGSILCRIHVLQRWSAYTSMIASEANSAFREESYREHMTGHIVRANNGFELLSVHTKQLLKCVHGCIVS